MSYRSYTTLGLAIIYVLAALLGFLMQRPDWTVTLVWPPAGVALAAVLLLGRLALPGIFLGALATNLIVLPAATQSSLIDLHSAAALRTLGVALIIAATSTLAAQVAATGLQRVVPGAPFWNSAAELLLGTVVISLACTISASGGMGGLYILGLLPAHTSPAGWAMWWLANYCGMVIFTPLLYLVARRWTKHPLESKQGSIITPTLLNSAITAIALTTFLALWSNETARIQQSLTQASTATAFNITQGLYSTARDMKAIRALFYASENVTADEFRRYVAVEFGSRVAAASAQRVGWAPRVVNREAWEAEMQNGGQTGVRLYELGKSGRPVPAAQRDEYFPLQFVRPLVEGDLRSIGFDVGSELLARATLERARDTGEVSMAAPIDSLSGGVAGRAILICAPIYRPDSELDTIAARRASLTGFALGVYLIDAVFDKALIRDRADIDLHLFDETLPLDEQWLATKTSPFRTPDTAVAPTLAILGRRPHGTALINFADHTWRLVAAPGPTYIADQRTWIPWSALALLLALGIIMSWIFLQRMLAYKRIAVEHRKTEQALVEAQAANDSKEFFMAAAAHDIKQPLFALGILADTLLLSDPTASIVPLLKRLRNSIDQMSRHFDTLMDVGRFRNDSFEVNRTRFALGEFSQRIDLEIAPLCASKGLIWKLEMDDVTVFTDPELLLRLCRNLLTNAVQYTDSGEVCCSAKAHGDIVEFLISDTGIGIPAELQEEVFKRFVRLTAGTVGTAGAGLGLSIVEAISRALELGLRMSSTLGVGTQFSFRLPRVSARH
jgi:signal transduction histidine kinase